jgi:hypothetical protein
MKDHYTLTLGKMGLTGPTKSFGGLGSKKYLHLLKSLSSQSLLVAPHYRQLMDSSGHPQIHKSRLGGGMDLSGKQKYSQLLHHLEGSNQILPCNWGWTGLENW